MVSDPAEVKNVTTPTCSRYAIDPDKKLNSFRTERVCD